MGEENIFKNIRRNRMAIPGSFLDEDFFGIYEQNISFQNGLERVEKRISPYYCRCGRPIGRLNSYKCHHCGRILCNKCAVEFHEEFHCDRCIRVYHHNLSKKDYYTLLCIFVGLGKLDKIRSLLGLERRDLKNIVQKLIWNKYLTEKGFFIFKKYSLSQLGLEALTLYDKIYGFTPDSRIIKQRIKYLVENIGDGFGGRYHSLCKKFGKFFRQR